MKKRLTIIFLFIFAFSLSGTVFALARFKPVLTDSSQSNPMHFEFEQNPEQTFSLNCNWYPTCPAHPSEPCIWVQELNREGVLHV